MHFCKSLLVAATALTLAACTDSTEPPAADTDTAAAEATPSIFAQAELVNAAGEPAGTATITPEGDTMVLKLAVTGLTAGEHGVHLHTVGSCEAPAFTSAGAHLNPHNKMHGHENPQGSHLGDLPNLTVGEDGKAEVTVPLDAPRAELEQYLMDDDGTAVVVHAGPDDYRTDPSGNSGDRIACGVLAGA